MKNLEKAVGFLKDIKKKDNVVIVFHNDGDGVSSTVLLKKVLPCDPLMINQPMPVDDNLIEKIKTTVPNKIIFLDLAIDQQLDIMKKVSSLCKILVIDHHLVTNNLNNRNIIHINPRFDNKEIYQSVAYIIYKICSEIKDMSKWLWIAAIGMIADYDLKNSEDLMEQIKKAYPNINKTEIRDSIFSNIADMISASKATKELTLEQIIDMLDNMESPDDIGEITNGRKLIHSYEIVENELVSAMIDSENAEREKKMILYELKSKYNLRSPLSTRLSEKYPKYFIGIWQKIGNKIKMSARNQSCDFNVDHVLKKAGEGLDALAGGHQASGGATINEKDWEKFKEKLFSIVNK